MPSNITLVAAIDRNLAIGFQGDQLVYISDDLRHFKALTQGKTVIMGRRTNQALPHGHLPNRRNIVLTRDTSFALPQVEVAHSVPEALQLTDSDPEVCIIGGEQIYCAFMPYASLLKLTLIDHAFPQADTFFPPLNGWHQVETSETFTDPKSSLNFRFVTFAKD